MSESYLGEIRMFAGNFAPRGWALCNGQLLSISENEALFTLLGTTYGGDGRNTFALPDLQGRIPIHPSSSYPRGSKGGAETVTLTVDNLPRHTHLPMANTTTAASNSPVNNVWSCNSYQNFYNEANPPIISMSPNTLSTVGGNQPHNNMMPSTTISFIISLYGVFPPQP